MAQFSLIAQDTESQTRLDAFLSQRMGISRSLAQEQIRKGHILRNGQAVRKAAQRVREGDVFSGEILENFSSPLVPVAQELNILFEDDVLLVINKPQGWVVHPAVGHRENTLVHYLLHYLQNTPSFFQMPSERPGIVHRLDKGTSGVMLIAKSRAVQEILCHQFKNRMIKKEYEAVVFGILKSSGEFRSAIGRDVKNRKKMSSKTLAGREAITQWRLQKNYSRFSHVLLFPQTGRTHQLRVHLTENGTPIVGDKIYMRRFAPIENSNISIFLEPIVFPFLHAKKITLEHPLTHQTLTFEAPRPLFFEQFLALLNHEGTR